MSDWLLSKVELAALMRMAGNFYLTRRFPRQWRVRRAGLSTFPLRRLPESASHSFSTAIAPASAADTKHRAARKCTS